MFAGVARQFSYAASIGTLWMERRGGSELKIERATGNFIPWPRGGPYYFLLAPYSNAVLICSAWGAFGLTGLATSAFFIEVVLPITDFF